MTMDSRNVSRRALLTSFFATTGAAAAMAQGRKFVRPTGPDGKQAEPLVLSGSDIGFRVDHEEADGAITGALVVKVDGKWVDAKSIVGLRRATESQ
jgi:hypothetical protein